MSSRRGAPHRRSVNLCGSKGGGNDYDPQIASAANSEAQTAEQAENFSEQYYTNTVAPLLSAEENQANTTTSEQQQLYNINEPEAAAAANEYNNYGLPAQTSFYNMATSYSAPQEMQSEAEASLGDMRAAEASNAASLARQQASYGIDPTSGAAVSANSVAAQNNAAAEAQAMTQARYNAKQLGMQLSADAAQFSATGTAGNVGSFSGSSSSSASGALGAAATATQSADSSASVPLAGYQIANSAYGNNLNAYTSLGNTSMQVNAAADSGLGSALGALGALATKIPI